MVVVDDGNFELPKNLDRKSGRGRLPVLTPREKRGGRRQGKKTSYKKQGTLTWGDGSMCSGR